MSEFRDPAGVPEMNQRDLLRIWVTCVLFHRAQEHLHLVLVLAEEVVNGLILGHGKVANESKEHIQLVLGHALLVPQLNEGA